MTTLSTFNHSSITKIKVLNLNWSVDLLSEELNQEGII